MTSHEEFLRTIIAHPNSMRARKRYAEWLEDQLDPLGEFINVQCQLHRLIEQKRTFGKLNREQRDVVLALDIRERELSREYEDEWVGPIGQWADYWTFRGGLIDEIGITSKALFEHSEEIFQRAPIQVLHIKELGTTLPLLLEIPQLTRLRFLDVSSNPLGDTGAYLLATAPNLQQLTGLNLTDTMIGDRGAEVIGLSKYLRNLRELYLNDNPIGKLGVRGLTESSNLKRLEKLYYDQPCDSTPYDDLPF